MPIRDAAPSPKSRPIENLNASGGRSNATAGSKCSAPVTITPSVVARVPSQSATVSLPIDAMRR